MRRNAKDIDLNEEIVKDLSDSLQITCAFMHKVGKLIGSTNTDKYDCCSAGTPTASVHDRSQITCVGRLPSGASPFGIDKTQFCPKCPAGVIVHSWLWCQSLNPTVPV